MRALLLVAAGLGLSGCIAVELERPNVDYDYAGPGPGLERLYAAAVEPDGLRVRVASNGCTGEDSFDIDVDRVGGAGSPRYRVRLERENPDNCRAYLVDGVELFFSRQRLGLADDAVILVANPVQR